MQQDPNAVLINAGQPIELVQQDIRKAVQKFIEENV